MRVLTVILAGIALAAAGAAPARTSGAWHLVPGQFEPNRGPDGNSVFLDAPDGLILVDTGRHPEHRDRLLAYARERRRPIVAIVNTHWHLDHSTGNGEIRAAYPRAEIYTSEAIEGALTGFLARSRADVERQLAAGQIPPGAAPRSRALLATMANPAAAPADPAGDAIGGRDDRRAPAAGEPRAVRRDRGRRLDLRSRRAAGRSPATSSSPRCRSWTPPARKAGAARSTRSPRRGSPP